jgi:homoserine kinase
MVLPDLVPRADALFNTSRAAVLMLALASRPDLLMAGTEDRLHQEYRRGVLPASMAVVDSLRSQGYPAVVSGAGPTVLVLATLSDQVCFSLERSGWLVLSPSIDMTGAVLV